MTIKELRNKTNMTQKDFADYLNIPVRTLQDWEQGRRTPPEYVIELIEYKIKKERIIMKTMFNQEGIKIISRENGGDCEYDYNYFKEGFEEWATDLEMSLPDVNDLNRYIEECGYNVVEIIERES